MPIRNQKRFDSILVFALPSLGDVLLSTPLLRSLRRAYPESVLDVLVYEGQDGILEGNPDVNARLTVSKHPGLREYWRLMRRICRRYDLAISTGTSDRAQLYTAVAGRTRLSLVPPHKQAWKRKLLHGYVPVDEGIHTVSEHNRLATLLGIEPCYEVVPPRLNGSHSSRLPSAAHTGDNYAVIHVVPGMGYKRWTVSGWIAVGRFLSDMGMKIFLTGGGSKAEQELVEAVRDGIGSGAVSLAGRLRLAEVTDLLQGCRIYAGPDTVVTHLAAAAGVPTVAVFGPTRPDKWGPWPKTHTGCAAPYLPVGSGRVGNVYVVQGNAPCVPCGREGCEGHRLSHSDCLDQLPSSRVIDAAREMLETVSDSQLRAHI